ncbi:MAG: MBL fold metallo-hydrolase [Spirochaetales bacterium]|nr:MBL fold metallo-hydrolase [Spirochaetales bacterium]
MKITVLGSGTSTGVPVIGCSCPVCTSDNPRNRRTRCSLLVETDRGNILIDTPPDLREQLLKQKVRSLAGVLYTHAHADHLHGIDDLRPLSHGATLPLYGQGEVLSEIRRRFPYIFGETVQRGGGKPRLTTEEVASPFILAGLSVTPIPVFHGVIPIYGYRIGDFLYITDCSRIPEESLPLIEGCRYMILGGLRYEPHETHFTIGEALEVIKKTGPERAWLTHITHDVDHDRLEKELPWPVSPAYDGLSFLC